MASLRLLRNAKNDLFLLNQLSEEEISLLVESSFEHLRNGLPKAVLKKLSQSLRLNTSEDTLNAITGVIFLLSAFYNHEISEEDFSHLGAELELSESVLKTIHKIYQKHEREFGKLSQRAETVTTQFRDLQWRLESEISSRSLRNNCTPRVVLSLSLESHGKTENIPLVSDIPNIIHFNHMVEQALTEGRSQNSRRLQNILQ